MIPPSHGLGRLCRIGFFPTALKGRWGNAIPCTGITALMGGRDLPGQQVRQSRPDPEPGLQPPAPRQGEKALEQRFPAVMGTLPGQLATASYVTRREEMGESSWLLTLANMELSCFPEP